MVKRATGSIFIAVAAWSDAERNLHFTIDAPLGREDILHIAEGIHLVETTK